MLNCHVKVTTLTTNGVSRYQARCSTHNTNSMNHFVSYSDACEFYRCDPNNRRFLVCDRSPDNEPGENIPFLLDLSGLAELLAKNYYHDYYGNSGRHYDIFEVSIPAYGRTVNSNPIVVSIHAGNFGEEDYRIDFVEAHYLNDFKKESPVVSVSVMIDGRA